MSSRGKRAQTATKTFTIDRSRWGCGLPEGGSLQDSRGLRCCLGFFALACGLHTNDIWYATLPTNVSATARYKWRTAAPWLFRMNSYSQATDDLVERNDNRRISQKTRESEITKIFSEHGWKVKFVGRLAK